MKTWSFKQTRSKCVIQSWKSTDKCILQMKKIISIFKILPQIQDTLYSVYVTHPEVTPGINAPLSLLLLWCNFSWYKILLQNQSNIQWKTFFQTKFQQQKPPKVAALPRTAHSNTAKEESPHSWTDKPPKVRPDFCGWLGVFFGWFVFYCLGFCLFGGLVFLRVFVSYFLKKNILCNILKWSVNAVFRKSDLSHKLNTQRDMEDGLSDLIPRPKKNSWHLFGFLQDLRKGRYS